MAMQPRNTIMLKKYNDVREEGKLTAGPILPGAPIVFYDEDMIRAASATTPVVMVAIEDDLQGKTMSHPYIVNTRIQGWIPGPGDIFYGRMAIADIGVTFGTAVSMGAGIFSTSGTVVVGEVCGPGVADPDNTSTCLVPIRRA